MSGDINFGDDNKIYWERNTDSASISFKNDGDGDADSYMSFVTSDNGNEYFRWSHRSGSTNTEWMALRSDGLRVGGTKVSLEGHTHDDRYIKKSGDTMLGALNFANGTWNLVGNDSYMGDCNISGHFGIKAANTTYPGIAFFNNSGTHLGNLTAYSGNIKYGAYSLQFLDNGSTSVSASNWMNPFSTYDSNSVADGQAICVWGQSSSLSNLAADTGDMSLWLKRVNANVATLNMVLNGEYYANGNQRLAHVSEIPNSLKNPYALTISLNGTSQGPYDGSTAKNINITPSSIGAATSDHNHDGRYVYNYGDTANVNGQALNQNALFMSTTSGITEDWWHILQAAWNSEYRLNSQIAFPTQNRNGMYYRSGLDDNTAWGAWVKLLDVNNYSSTLDSRYYTESEINTLLDSKLNRQNLSYGAWNPRGYNLAADYYYNGGDLSISESGGQIHVSVDGYFWQNDGQYRVLDTSDVAGLKNNLTVHQYLSNTDTAWYPLIWGGSFHNNTNDSTGPVYKSYDKLSWQTSSQTLYATNIQTNNIKNLSIGGGIYWNPCVESTIDGSDAASITLVKSGVAGGTTLVLSQMNDANDTIQFQTNDFSRLYHNSYPILTTQNTYVSNNKGYINGTEITQVNNADTVDSYHIADESRQVYRNYYTVDSPDGAWILIKFPAWNAVNEIVSIDGYGDNRQAHCVVYCGSRFQGIWGYQSEYNGVVVAKIRWKEADSGKFALVVLIDGGITNLSIKSTNSLEISKTTADNAAFAISSSFFSSSGVFHGKVDWDNIIDKPAKGGDRYHPIFLGYLDLDHGDDGVVGSSFYCLGYSVPFTYTRGGNYCRILIPDTEHQLFYIRAATASVHYSGGGMDTWTGVHRADGAWWLHCYAAGLNEVRVKGFCQHNKHNDSWWGGNPLLSDRGGANRITVCIFGEVVFRH